LSGCLGGAPISYRVPVDVASLAAELLDRLPANRTLGLTITEVRDGLGSATLPVSDRVRNVIGALHSSGVAALADAAGLAAALSMAPDEAMARRLQPLGVHARLTFHHPCAARRSPRASSTPRAGPRLTACSPDTISGHGSRR
jgi:uncharacterized protein (TIGR00369 family)